MPTKYSRTKIVTDTSSLISLQTGDILELMKNRRNGCKQEQQQKPPSSDGFKSPVPKAREKRAAKKSGGQKGHKGHTLEPVAKSDHIEVHKAWQCAA